MWSKLRDLLKLQVDELRSVQIRYLTFVDKDEAADRVATTINDMERNVNSRFDGFDAASSALVQLVSPP
jgi:hypothetical protein